MCQDDSLMIPCSKPYLCERRRVNLFSVSHKRVYSKLTPGGTQFSTISLYIVGAKDWLHLFDSNDYTYYILYKYIYKAVHIT